MSLRRVYGPVLFPEIGLQDLKHLAQTSRHTPFQYYSMMGWIGENRIIDYLQNHRNIRNVRKIPDGGYGHSGDVEFTFKGKLFTMEIKSLTLKQDGKGRISVRPQRGAKVQAYRRGDFDLVGVTVTNRSTPPFLFCHVNNLPDHRVEPGCIAAATTVSESKNYTPFGTDLIKILSE